MRFLSLGCLALLSLLQPAAAQPRADRDAEICVIGTGNASLENAVCGRALRDPDLSWVDRASVHVARGKPLRAMQRHPDAMAEFDGSLIGLDALRRLAKTRRTRAGREGRSRNP